MIQLTPTRTRQNIKGIEVDATLYLDRVDNNNLAIKEGDKIVAYFGCVRTALSRALNYAIKGSPVALELKSIQETINHMDEAISKLDNTVLKELLSLPEEEPKE